MVPAQLYWNFPSAWVFVHKHEQRLSENMSDTRREDGSMLTVKCLLESDWLITAMSPTQLIRSTKIHLHISTYSRYTLPHLSSIGITVPEKPYLTVALLRLYAHGPNFAYELQILSCVYCSFPDAIIRYNHCSKLCSAFLELIDILFRNSSYHY